MKKPLYAGKWRTIQCGACGGQVQMIDGQWLRYGRERCGVSLRAVARGLKLSAAFVSDVELNRRRCNPKMLAYYERLHRSTKWTRQLTI